MKKKYTLIDDVKEINGHTLHRIKAMDYVGLTVKPGDLGGWIENEDNLSHEGDCWVYGESCVYDNAKVYENGQVFEGAFVFDDAKIYGQAHVHGPNTKVYGMAEVFGRGLVKAEAKVYDTAKVYDIGVVSKWASAHGDIAVCHNLSIAKDYYKKKKFILTNQTMEHNGYILHRIQAIKDIYSNSRNTKLVSKGDLGGWIQKDFNLSHLGNCWVFDTAKVYDSAEVYDDTHVCDNAEVYSYAKVSGSSYVMHNSRVYDHTVLKDAVISDNSIVCGTATIADSSIFDYCKIAGNANINKSVVLKNCIILGGKIVNSKVSGNVTVYINSGVEFISSTVSGCFTAKSSKVIDNTTFKLSDNSII